MAVLVVNLTSKLGSKVGQGFESRTFQVDFWVLKLFHVPLTCRGIHTCINVSHNAKKLTKRKILIGGSYTTVLLDVYFYLPLNMVSLRCM